MLYGTEIHSHTVHTDDTVVYSSDNNLNALNNTVQEDLDKITKWCYFNKLKINAGKTKAMFFDHAQSKRQDVDVGNLILNASQIEYVEKYDYLGVTIETDLKFKRHIEKSFTRINNKLYVFTCMRKSMNTKAAVMVYKSMVLPFFEYGNVFLSTCTERDLTKLQRLQNRGLRTALGKENTSNVYEMHMDAHILPIKLRAKIALMKIMFSLKENDQFIDNRVLTTRAHTATVFKVARPKSCIFQNSVAYVGPRDWDNLSVDLRSVNDMKAFDCLIKNFWAVFTERNHVSL